MAKNTKQEPPAQSAFDIEQTYIGIRKGLRIGIAFVVAVVIGLTVFRPAGYLAIIAFLIVFEAITYPMLMNKLAKTRDIRLAELNAPKPQVAAGDDAPPA